VWDATPSVLEQLETALDRFGTSSRVDLAPLTTAYLEEAADPNTAPPDTLTTLARQSGAIPATSTAAGQMRADPNTSPADVLRQLSRDGGAPEGATGDGAGPVSEVGCDGRPPAGRTIHASMMGTASLHVDGCSVQFSRGRLIRFGKPGAGGGRRARYLAEPTGGFLRTRERTYVLTPESAFSFEEDEHLGRGLMTVHVLAGEELAMKGRLLVDYTAVGDSPWLFVDLCFELPVPENPHAVEELAPFAIPIRLPDGEQGQSLVTEYPDGSTSRVDLRHTRGPGYVYGSLLQAGGRVTMAWVAAERQATGAFAFSVDRSLAGSVLTLFPLGRFDGAALARRAGSILRARFALTQGTEDFRAFAAERHAVDFRRPG